MKLCMGNIIIQIADLSEDFPTLQEIRKIVFHEEQAINPELEFDGLDEISQHLIAFLNRLLLEIKYAEHQNPCSVT